MGSTAKVGACAIVLHEACARNLPVELHQDTDDDGVLVARTRVLDLDDECLYVDSVQSVGSSVSFDRKAGIVAYLQLNGTRYSFQSRVVSTGCWVKLNDEKRVRGASLAKPARVEEGQRREDYRVSLATIDLPHISLHEAPDNDPGACPLDAARFQANVVDLSRGGMSILVRAADRRGFRRGALYFVNTEFPDGSGELTLLAEVRHVRRLLDGETTRLGLKFVRWNGRFTQPILQRVGQYCADVERQSLKRRR